jgi:hypothetical protein
VLQTTAKDTDAEKNMISLVFEQVITSFRPMLHQESGLMFNPNQAFLVMQKLKSAPTGFTLGVKAELKRNPFQSAQSY